jgi:hypothetical protein
MRPSAATGCAVLFLLPFAGGGVAATLGAARAAARGDWGQAGLLCIFALVFGGVGIGGIIGALAGKRRLAEREAREAGNPDAPWLWRTDWAAGRIEDGGRGTMWAAWLFAGFWNLVSLPGAFFAVRSALQGGERAGWVALLFPLVGVGLLVWAVQATLRYRRYGVSVAELRTVPGAVGRSLAGVVRTTALVQPTEGFRVRLVCLRRVTRGSGKNRSTSETILWEEERQVRGEPARTAHGMTTAVPFAFAIPGEATPCDSSTPRDRVLWRLDVSASVPGVDYASSFEVPVFRASTGELPLSEPVPPLLPEDYRQSPTSRIRVTSNRRGTEVHFPAARNPGAAAGATLFFVIWAGAVGLMLGLGAPALLIAVFVLVGLLVLWAALELWLRVTRVTAGADGVVLGKGWLAPARERRFAPGEVTGVRTRIGMQAGGSAYYDLLLVRRDGTTVTAAHAIREKREAEWLAAMLEGAISGSAAPGSRTR